MSTPEERERESQESSETKYDELVERESEERAKEAEQLRDLPPPREETEGD
jgi:hypothetical protein